MGHIDYIMGHIGTCQVGIKIVVQQFTANSITRYRVHSLSYGPGIIS